MSLEFLAWTAYVAPLVGMLVVLLRRITRREAIEF